MAQSSKDEERQDGPGEPADGEDRSRPEQILRETADRDAISDEEAVLAYNANADRANEEPGADGKH